MSWSAWTEDPDKDDFVYVRSETVYDEQGQRVQTIENLKQATLDENAAVDDTMARTTDYEYEDGRLAAVVLPGVLDTDPASATYQQVVRPRYAYTYDIYGNQKSITDPKGRVTKFTYDELHRQTSRQLPVGVIAGDTTFTETMHYSDTPLANLLLLTTPEISVGLGQIEYTVDFEGRVTAYRYDNSPNGGGRLVARYYYDERDDYTTDAGDDSLDNPDEVVSYTHDALGRQTQVVQDFDPNSVGEERITGNKYDVFGRPIQIASPEGIVNYAYDAVGRVKRTWTSVGTTGADLDNAITDTTYGYDELGRLETVTVVERNDVPLGGAAEETTYAYDDVGNLDTVTHSNGVVSDYDFDDWNRLTSLTHTAGMTVLADFSYEVDTDGKRRSETESVAGTTFDWVYDNLGRLISETYDGPSDDYTAEYFFDLASNRVRKDVDTTGDGVPDERTDYTYDDNDRLLTEIFDLDLDGADKTTCYSPTRYAWRTETPFSTP